MRLSELYQQHYFYEIERRDKLNNFLSIPLGVVSIITGALIIIAKEIDAPFDVVEWFQIIVITLTAFSILYASIYISLAYRSVVYFYIPMVGDVKKYYEDLVGHYISIKKTQDESEEIAEKETLDYIYKSYSVNSDINTKNNDKKSLFVSRANKAIFLSFVLLIFAATPYVINAIVQPSEIQKVELVNVKDLSLCQSAIPLKGRK